MGLAVDTVGFHKTAAAVAGSTATVSSGDSFTIKSFTAPSTAKLVGLYRHDETGAEGFVQLVSTRFANSTTGVKARSKNSPSVDLLPQYGMQNLYSGDDLTVKLSSSATATKTTFGAFQVYYSNLEGLAARLHNWADIEGNIANLFTQTVAVDVTVAGTWVTVLAKNTDDLMNADTTYALLGYNTDIAYGVVGLKSQETGNLRICGPGCTTSADTSWYYVSKSVALGMPFIPVVQSNNRGGINVTANSGLATTGKVNLLWAQLTSPVTH